MKIRIPKEFNDIALERTGIVIKTGIAFDRSLKDMLAYAYALGFVDCNDAYVNGKEANDDKGLDDEQFK